MLRRMLSFKMRVQLKRIVGCGFVALGVLYIVSISAPVWEEGLSRVYEMERMQAGYMNITALQQQQKDRSLEEEAGTADGDVKGLADDYTKDECKPARNIYYVKVSLCIAQRCYIYLKLKRLGKRYWLIGRMQL